MQSVFKIRTIAACDCFQLLIDITCNLSIFSLRYQHWGQWQEWGEVMWRGYQVSYPQVECKKIGWNDREFDCPWGKRRNFLSACCFRCKSWKIESSPNYASVLLAVKKKKEKKSLKDELKR